ncbi:hypothetical protein ACFM35_00005, partial [Microbacterium sp. P01]
DWPLWESFTDQYTLTADELHLSPQLASDLHDWNSEWQNRQETDPLPLGWTERGRELHGRLQEELEDVAEVRPDFDSQ